MGQTWVVMQDLQPQFDLLATTTPSLSFDSNKVNGGWGFIEGYGPESRTYSIRYDLTSIGPEIPEPASFVLLAGGLWILRRVRDRSRN